MDQRELVRQLEEHFRKEDQPHHDQRKRVHEEREQMSDEEWWNQLVKQTAAIRPQMLPIFERNKEEMIAKRFQTVNSEEGFREKTIQRKVMSLLAHVSAIRAETGATGDLTIEQILAAEARAENPPSSKN